MEGTDDAAPADFGEDIGLSATSSPEGIFKVLAVDHRDSMRVFIAADDPHALSAQRPTDAKLGLIRELGAAATAIMVDPEYSAAPDWRVAVQRRADHSPRVRLPRLMREDVQLLSVQRRTLRYVDLD